VDEERGAIIENEVDTGKLLPCLDEDSGESTEKNPVVGWTEAVKVRQLVVFQLEPKISSDLLELCLNLWVIRSGRKKTRK
jgi:hypothetical protein